MHTGPPHATVSQSAPLQRSVQICFRRSSTKPEQTLLWGRSGPTLRAHQSLKKTSGADTAKPQNGRFGNRTEIATEKNSPAWDHQDACGAHQHEGPCACHCFAQPRGLPRSAFRQPVTSQKFRRPRTFNQEPKGKTGEIRSFPEKAGGHSGQKKKQGRRAALGLGQTSLNRKKKGFRPSSAIGLGVLIFYSVTSL